MSPWRNGISGCVLGYWGSVCCCEDGRGGWRKVVAWEHGTAARQRADPIQSNPIPSSIRQRTAGAASAIQNHKCKTVQVPKQARSIQLGRHTLFSSSSSRLIWSKIYLRLTKTPFRKKKNWVKCTGNSYSFVKVSSKFLNVHFERLEIYLTPSRIGPRVHVNNKNYPFQLFSSSRLRPGLDPE